MKKSSWSPPCLDGNYVLTLKFRSKIDVVNDHLLVFNFENRSASSLEEVDAYTKKLKPFKFMRGN